MIQVAFNRYSSKLFSSQLHIIKSGDELFVQMPGMLYLEAKALTSSATFLISSSASRAGRKSFSCLPTEP